MATSVIVIRGAREHNLRDVSLDLPKGKLICFTGVSGSGKSSLAFDTLYAEGQRRYVESLSSYARQFLGQMPKPQVDRIDGLSPSISIQQKSAGKNPRSTVGTITEIHDYLRVLFARVGRGHCPKCDRPVSAQTREQIVQRILQLPQEETCLILAPVVRGQKGEYKELFADLSRAGYVRARVDSRVIRLDEPPLLDRQIKHDIEVVIDRLNAANSERARLAEAVETALKLGEGTLLVSVENKEDLVFSSRYACVECGIGFDAPSPQLFSFNSPQGMCPGCDGLGTRFDFEETRLVPDPSLSLWEGAIKPLGPVKELGKWKRHLFEGVAASLESDPDGPAKNSLLKGPWSRLAEKHRQAWLYGTGDRVHPLRYRGRGRGWVHTDKWAGVATELLEKYKGSEGGVLRSMLEPYLVSRKCTECGGSRLNPRARAVRTGGITLPELEGLTISEAQAFFRYLSGTAEAPPSLSLKISPLDGLSQTIAAELIKEIRQRIGFLVDVGLHYLTLDRAAPTLSGGETQRIRLASQVGSGLVGVLYILDEPSIGLHTRDNDRLIATLKRLRDVGNTVIVVEHDEDTMRAADHVVDFGPGPGVNGGAIVAQGTLREVSQCRESLTGQYLSGRARIEIPAERRPPDQRSITVHKARHHNLKDIDVSFPVGLFVCVTGVSGSGKSSLVGDILREVLAAQLNGAQTQPGIHDHISGIEHLDKIIDIDQSPIGRTPRSNPATYIKLFDEIRDLYAKLPDARARGYKPGRFSFNVTGGRCEACDGNGSNRLEMDFLADVWVTCPVCEGKRFSRETLHVRFKGKSISDVLEMDVQEALEHFSNVPRVAGMLQTLHDVGLDYLKLGQPSPTLSGGEAQRIKLARELVKRSTGRTLYILDEPTTGLHFDDIQKLLNVLHRFTAEGNTVVVIEHNLDVIKTADWVIDLGPEGGAGGGEIVAEGTPEQLAQISSSYTGQALARALAGPRKASAGKARKSGSQSKKGATQTEQSVIQIRGAAQHNLKDIDVDIPRNRLTVCSGPSGSGKSSLAIDTLYAEGQRRYVESLSSYARQFLSPLQKPKVEHISGLAPAISIEQKTTSKSPRSTVGTVTEIHDYIRILMARLGHPHCPSCNVPVGTQSGDEIVEKILHGREGSRLYLMAPIERREGESYEELWVELKGSGFARVRVDGKSHSLDDPPSLSPRRKHLVEVVVDRVVVRRSTRSRLADSVEAALDLGRGVMHVAEVGEEDREADWPVHRYSQHLSCEHCGKSLEQLSPHHFSFNSPLGWCPSCEGLGVQTGSDPAELIPDDRKSLRGGAVAVWPDFKDSPFFCRMIEALAQACSIEMDSPFADLDARQRRAILHGSGTLWITVPAAAGQPEFRFQYKGLFPALEEAGRISFVYRMRLSGMVGEVECGVCMGSRLREDASAVRFRGHTLDQISRWTLGRTLEFFRSLKLSKDEKHIAGDLIREIRERLSFLVEVGLEYLSLARGTPTLSGGEAQRIRLASQLGSGLTGVLYVLDEPTIGLHPRDNRRLLGALKRLRDLGNTLVVVEHDREVLESADHLVDFGPGAGDQGGRVTATGRLAHVKKVPDSLTGRFLSGKESIPVPTNRRDVSGPRVIIRGARHNNLKGIDAEFPIGSVTVVTGVSGSGKSTLIEEILWKAAAKRLHRASASPGAHDRVEGLEHLDKVIRVDQSPIGSTPKSNAATYTGLFDQVRELFSRLPEAKVKGYTPGRFSFNMPGGRCEACEGAGQKRVEMHFLPDVWITCEDCGGTRYTPETLSIKFRGRSIADVLDMNVDGALDLFAAVPRLRRVLQTLSDVGLGYLPLGQSGATLSGGEAQRVKLSAELARPDTGSTLYVLDEPTTGLHFSDVRKLLSVVHRLADLGNTVVIIEHNLEVIKTADWVLDLGPEAGNDGGEIVVAGPPETVAQTEGSHTGAILRATLAAGPHQERQRFDPKAEAARQIEEARRAAAADKASISVDVKMPWQVDGQRWHTSERLTRTGKPVRWDGAILQYVVNLVTCDRDLGEVDWSERSVVRWPVAQVRWPPVFQAVTTSEWVLTLRFHVPRYTFMSDALERSLGLTRFVDCEPPVPCELPRVSVRSVPKIGQEVTVVVHRMQDVNNPKFTAFVEQALDAALGPRPAAQPMPEPGWVVVTKKTKLPKKKPKK